MRAAWYVSSHGWGHAARQRELLRAWLGRRPDAEVTVTTEVPGWFWDGMERVQTRRAAAGPMPVEGNGCADPEATAGALRDFCERADEVVEREHRFLEKDDFGLVVSDIDPAPFAAADRLGIPAYGVANFTWDWIYARMLPDMEREVGLLRRLYRTGTYLRLPLGPPEHPFGECRQVGLLPGGVPRDPDAARRLLGPGRVCLVSLRDPARLGGPLPEVPGWVLVSALPENRFGLPRNLTPADMRRAGVSFADLVAAADAVLCKPGYGMVSQILCGGLRAVVLRRTDFPETPYLTEPLHGRPGVLLAAAPRVRRSLPDLLADLLRQPAAISLPSPLNGDGGILTQIRE
jgi:L-arabinokinase